MKRAIFLLLIFISLQSFAQPRNLVSITYQPSDAGIGVRYDRLFKTVKVITSKADTLLFPRMSIYGAYAHGNYIYPNITIKDHNRYEIGVSYALWPYNPDEKLYSYFTGGLVFHTFGEMDYEPYSLNFRALDAFSITLGVGNRFNRICFGVRYDPMKQESCIDLGYIF